MPRLLLVMVCFFLIGCEAAEESWCNKNGTVIRYATFHVDKMYQTCPLTGKTVSDGWVVGSANSNYWKKIESRLTKLETQTDQLNLKNQLLQEEVDVLKEGGQVDGKTCDVTEKQILDYKRSSQTVKKVDGSLPKDCAEIYNRGHRISGVYWIKPHGSPTPVQALCDLTMVEGWTVIMHRFNGSVDFYRRWADYKKGFGSPSGEHWIGNDVIHYLTNQKKYKLRVEFTYWTGGHSYSADYATFKVESEASKYKLSVSGYSGNSGYDGWTPHNGQYFTTQDKDNDSWSPGNCAVRATKWGAFWYNSCFHTNPTGPYTGKDTGMYYSKPTKTMALKIAPSI